MKIGDKVRFLNETGGGRIAGFQGKNIVLVEDEDGFQIPMHVKNVIVADDGDQYSNIDVADTSLDGQKPHASESYAMLRENERAQSKPLDAYAAKTNGQREAPIDRVSTAKTSTNESCIEERDGGNVLNCYLAFVPKDIKSFSKTRFKCYFVNDSNYFVRYNYLVIDGLSSSLLLSEEVEPNMLHLINEIGREDLNDYNRIAVQLLAYKRNKSFVAKSPVDVQIRLDKTKFYKFHTFRETDFFDEPALLYPIIENDKPLRPLVIDADKIKQEMCSVAPAANTEQTKRRDDGYVRRYDNGRKGNPFIIRRKADADAVVVDLHAAELLETTAGMSASDILSYQLDVVRRTLDAHKREKGRRIIFIHGKGEGVLRQAIIHELRYRYKSYVYQDASFQEYGYGATQVTIR